jgi:hypothetical protein
MAMADLKPIRVSIATYEAIKEMMAEGDTLVQTVERVFAAGAAALAMGGKSALPGSGAAINAYTEELVNGWEPYTGETLDYAGKVHKLVVCGIGRFESLRKDREKTLARKAQLAGKAVAK